MIAGIDIGSTVTKAVAVEDGRVARMVKARAEDAITSATGAFGKLLMGGEDADGKGGQNGVIPLNHIERVIMTGAGAGEITGDIFGIPTEKLAEFPSVGIGAMFLSGRENIVIVNMGTGTAFLHATMKSITHIGGSGVGGGTILGLAKSLIGLSTFGDIMDAAKTGRLNQVDLLLSDIMQSNLSFLSNDSTAANFGKMLDTASKNDIALAILNLAYQVVGMLAVFAAKGKGVSSVVMTGAGAGNAVGRDIFASISEMYNVKFEYPQNAQYTTAIGAALSSLEPWKSAALS
jgi:type II pantothenate kinase